MRTTSKNLKVYFVANVNNSNDYIANIYAFTRNLMMQNTQIYEIFNVQCFITFNDRNISLLCKKYFSESIADICPDVYASRIISKAFSTRKYFIYKA